MAIELFAEKQKNPTIIIKNIKARKSSKQIAPSTGAITTRSLEPETAVIRNRN
jgi:hypothetical protein